MNEVWLQLILSMAGFFFGLFALIRYFLKHLEKKDASMERMSKDFSNTINNHLHDDTIVKQQLVDSHRALTKAIDHLVYKK